MNISTGKIVGDKNETIFLRETLVLIDGAARPITTHASETHQHDLIKVRSGGNFEGSAFYLNPNFNWDIVIDDMGLACLVPTKKK